MYLIWISYVYLLVELMNLVIACSMSKQYTTANLSNGRLLLRSGSATVDPRVACLVVEEKIDFVDDNETTLAQTVWQLRSHYQPVDSITTKHYIGHLPVWVTADSVKECLNAAQAHKSATVWHCCNAVLDAHSLKDQIHKLRARSVCFIKVMANNSVQ